MADRPIIFSAPMVRALLDGTKTQTRRVLKPQPPTPDRDRFFGATFGLDRDLADGARRISMNDWDRQPKHPTRWRLFGSVGVARDAGFPDTYDVHFAVGDRLWVRENFHLATGQVGDHAAAVRYAAAGDVQPARMDAPERNGPRSLSDRQRPSIHMPRWASRLTLTVTDVRVQRLQEISAADAEAEGAGHEAGVTGGQAREAFGLLWDRIHGIHGPSAWTANPWVVALTFTVARRNIDAGDAHG